MSRKFRDVATVLAPVILLTVTAASANDMIQGRVPEGLSASDWSSIRSAYDAGRHAAVAINEGYQTRNPGQQWRTRFDGCAFLVTPDHGEWTWGLQLVRYGRAGAERKVESPVCMDADGGRVHYQWDDALTEWFINDHRGLEHGYTIAERPPLTDARSGGTADHSATDDRLRITLATRGSLRPRVSADGRGVTFVDARGTSAVKYGGLLVIDADGHTIPAHFESCSLVGERAADTMVLTVDDRDARYPLTIDPFAQQAYLKASNTGSSDSFGISVAVSGDIAVVGAYKEGSNATGVNGNQANNLAAWSGAAYVFVRNGATWSQQAYLKASNTLQNNLFGESVAISGETVVVGSRWEKSGATGVNGNQNDFSAPQSGAAYVFVRNGATWSQQAYLKASNTTTGDLFGQSVSVSGDTIVVGANGEDSTSAGVNGDQFNDNSHDSGAAYVFVRSGESWSQQAYLKASDPAGADRFGRAVAVSGDLVVIGAENEDSNSTGVNGVQENYDAPQSGAAYVFTRTGAIWIQEAYLKASNTDTWDFFGGSVAISGNTIVIGAAGEASSTTGVNGNQSDNSSPGSGAAYVFVRIGSSWSQQAYLKESSTTTSDLFGTSVAISGNAIAVGATQEDSNATGVNGDSANNSSLDSGAAYAFVRDGSTWSTFAYLKASNTGSNDHFGSSIAISDGVVLVGAEFEDSNATGVGGNEANNSASSSGAAYAFDLGFPPECPADLDQDGEVGGTDIAIVLGAWGTTGAPGLTGDADLNGTVDGADIAVILGSWGACPR